MTIPGRFRSVRVLQIAALGALAASAADAVSVADAATENPFARQVGSFVSTPSSLTDVGGTLYFVADNGASGPELWKSDGTAWGTARVKDIAAGPAGSSPASLLNWNGTLVFTADDGVHGRELWKSDGTEAGTVMVKDVLPGVDGSAPASLVVLKGRLYFGADDGVHGRELWTSDGTDAGTSLVKDIRPGPEGSDPDSIIDQLYTAVRVGIGYDYVHDGMLYFAADDGVAGRELWRSDGTESGTELFADVRPGPEGSGPRNLLASDGDIVFSFVADDGVHGVAPWASWGGGIGDGTFMTRGVPTGADGKSAPFSIDGEFAVFDDADGGELWIVGGFEATKPEEVRPGPLGSSPRSIVRALGNVMFSADDGVSGRELWTTTYRFNQSPGTRRIADIAPGAAGSDPQSITEVSGLTVVFSADDGISGRELWASDGTEAGTRMLQDIVPGPAGSDPSQFTTSGTLLYFTATDPAGGPALYVAFRSRLGGRVYERDFDGDGFVDDVESAVGSSTVDPESTPDGLAAPHAGSVLERLAVRLNYARSGADTAALAGVFHAPRAFSPEGKRVFVDVGGAVRSFVLDARGVGATPQGDQFRFHAESRGATKVRARWSAKLAPTDLAAKLEPSGFQNITARGSGFPLTFVFIEGVGVVFSDTPDVRWRARAGRSSVAHLARRFRF